MIVGELQGRHRDKYSPPSILSSVGSQPHPLSHSDAPDHSVLDQLLMTQE